MGALLWRGPSAIDGAPLIVVATTGTDNRKTGDMIQTWILREDIAPHDAVASGADASICGSCYHRGAPDRPRTCYVNVGQASLSVWRAYHRGRYSADAELPDAPVRIGAYGDPAAVPISVWWPFVQRGRWTGYTHRWRECSQGYAAFLMASCETAADVRDARARGWRAFSTLQTDGAIECPSARGVKCADCRLCAGTDHARAPSIWIAPHGSASRSVPGGGA